MGEKFLISVIIPVYKVERYLERCIKSVVNQEYSNIEIILVEDGSPDKCPQICDEWGKKDSRIIVIHKENGGLSDARNIGIKAATGDFISFVDSDDWIDLNWLSLLVEKACQNDCDVVIGATRLINDKNEEILIRGKQSKIYTNEEAVAELIINKNIFATVCDKIYKRELIKDISFEIGKTNEDEFWSWKILMRASKIITCSETNYNYFQNSESIMGRKYNIKRLDGLDAHKERALKLKNYNVLWELCNQNLIMDCMYHLQCSYLFLEEPDKKNAIYHIREVMSVIDFKKVKYKTLKQFIWGTLFLHFPRMTCIIRNKLGIGL